MKLLRVECIVIVPRAPVLLAGIISERSLAVLTNSSIGNGARVTRRLEHSHILSFPTLNDIGIVVQLDQTSSHADLTVGAFELIDIFVVVGSDHQISGPANDHKVSVKVLAGLCPH